MKFLYSTIISEIPESQDYVLLRRPEIPVTIRGPNGSLTLLALVDTGSDNTIFPKSVADFLGILIEAENTQSASTFGGARIQLFLGEAMLQIEADEITARWPTTVSFFDSASPEHETVVVGHAGFLDYFTATFDGLLCELTLIPNDQLPSEPAHSSGE